MPPAFISKPALPYPAGVPNDKLASRLLGYHGLLQLSEALLQRKRDALVATMGKQAAQDILRMQPEVLTMTEERAALNIAALQQLFGVTRESAASILCSNTLLFKLDMQSGVMEAKLSARVAFWQQVYSLSAGESWLFATAAANALFCMVSKTAGLHAVNPLACFRFTGAH